MKNKLSELEYLDRWFIYRGLLELIKNGEGLPFHNSNPHHVAYFVDEDGGESTNDGDSSSENRTFLLMSAMADEMRGSQELPEEEIMDSWKKFCDLGRKYDKRRAHTS